MNLLAAAKRLALHIGRRGAFLLSMATLFLVSGYNFVVEPPSPQAQVAYKVILRYLTFTQLGYLWLAVGALMVLAAFWKKAEQSAFSAGTGIIWGFGLAFIAGIVAISIPQAIRGGLVYLTFGLLFLVVSGWREPHARD